MVLTSSTMLPLGTKAPPFSLVDAVSGERVSSDDFAGLKALLVMFICNHCPYVQHVRQGLAQLADFDDTQELARAYTAACTPDFFLFDAEQKLVYRGQFDESRPGNDVEVEVDGADLRRAIDRVLAGARVPEEQIPSAGCNIKWRAGNEPAYFRK